MLRPRILFLITALSWVLPDLANGADLLPHRAVYRMTLNQSVKSDVVAAQGNMFYSLVKSCDGWAVENRTLLRLAHDDDSESSSIWSFASWESRDGHTFLFRARYDQDGQNVEKLEGEAQMPADGGAGFARFVLPEATTIELPPGTLFPTEHIRQLISEAEHGNHTLNRLVFDGASEDNPYLVTAIFGALSEAARKELARANKLPEVPAWWVQLAFFPASGKDQLPEFEMGAQYRADGIADRIIQHFERFALDVRLRNVELLPVPKCDG